MRRVLRIIFNQAGLATIGIGLWLLYINAYQFSWKFVAILALILAIEFSISRILARNREI